MKYLFFSIALLCLTSLTTQAQDKPDSPCCCKDTTACFEKDKDYQRHPGNDVKDIILDFKAKALGIPRSLKITKGSYIRIKVVNYNPLVYKVNVDNRDSAVSQPNDGGLLEMFLSPDKFTSAVTGLINTIGTPPKAIPAPLFAINGFNITQKINFLKNNGYPTEWLQGKTIKAIDTLVYALDSATIVDRLLNIYIADIKKQKDRIQMFRGNVEKDLEAIATYYAGLQKLYLDCDRFNPTVIARDAENFRNQLHTDQYISQQIATKVFDSSSLFKFDVAPYFSYINNHPGFKIKYTFIDSVYKLAAAELTSIDTAISAKKINDMYASMIRLTQNTSCYVSLPIYVNSDVKNINISLKPVDDKSNLPSYQTAFSIPDYQRKIWGVSGGIFVSGLHNSVYTNKRKDNDTTYNLVADKQGKAQVGINALAYTGWQLTNTKPDYLGICFGAGMSLESKPKPRILAGASFITGDKNKIILSVGYTAGFVTELSDAFSTTANYVKPAESYQKDVLRGSVFFSINYSFLSK